MYSKSKELTLTAIFAGFSTLAFCIESLFPPIFIPGAKMGISNIFVLIALFTLGKSNAFCVLIAKILLGSLFSGNISAIIYSLPAGVTALCAEIALICFLKSISIVCVSIFGAVVNITLQNIVFCLVTKTMQYLLYLPYLALIGVLAGLVVGFACYLIIKFLLFNKFFKGD